MSLALGTSLFTASTVLVVGRYHRSSKSGSQVRRLTTALSTVVKKAMGQVDWEDLDGEHAFLEVRLVPYLVVVKALPM